MTDLVVTVADLGTAGGTALLAVATYFSTRSANASARSAERALLDGLRPILVPSHWEDPVQKVRFIDEHWVAVRGGRAAFDLADEAAYLVMSLRNVGRGVAVMHGWKLVSEALGPHAAPGEFRRLTRDIYIAPGENGFCQCAVREPDSADYEFLAARFADHGWIGVDVLYSDIEGGQRMITRLGLSRSPAKDATEAEWALSAARHWNLDRADPR